MIVVITREAGAQVVEQFQELVGSQGVLENVVVRGDGRRVLSFRGSEGLLEKLAACPDSAEVFQLRSAWSLLERSRRPGGHVVSVAGVPFGSALFPVIAGPCSVENLDQVRSIAEGVKKAGALGLRGGAFKPRTSTYAFQGLGAEGLRYLQAAKAATGLPIVTEVMSPEEVDEVASVADMLQIGSRNIQNFRLLEAVGRCRTPVLLKRGMMSTLEEFLGAAEYIFIRGNEDIVLCERGIRTFEPSMRNTLDLASVAMLKEMTHLPVIVDPSHGSGVASLVPPLARAALAVGADGLLIEVHNHPEAALSDGRQSLTLKGLQDLMGNLAPLAQVMGRRLGDAAAATLQA